MSKRQFKEALKRIRWLCSRCDLSWELPPKRFGSEQTVVVRRLEFQPKDDFALGFPISEGIKYLESFYSDVRAQQKLDRKKDKAFRYQVLEKCRKAGMGCLFTKRTRLNPPGFRIYDPVDYERVLGPKLTADEVRNLFKIRHLELSSTILPLKEMSSDQEEEK